MKQKLTLFSLLLLTMCHVLPLWAQDDGAQTVTQLQFGRQTVTVPADGELVFYDFKGLDAINSMSANNQHSLTVFKPAVEGLSVQITFENIDICNDGSSYPGKVIVYSGDPDPDESFAWQSTAMGVTGTTLMPEGDVMDTLDGVYSNLTYFSTAADGSMGVGVLWRYAKACDGWTAKVKCVKLTDMQVTGAGSSYDNVSASPRSRSGVVLASAYVDAEGVMNPDNLTGIRFSVPVNDSMIDPLSVKLYDGAGDNVGVLTPVDATVAADGSGYIITLDRPLASGRTVFTLAADILGSAKVGARTMVDITGVTTAAHPGGVTPFDGATAVEIVNPAMVTMVAGEQTVYVDETSLAFYDDGGVDGQITSKFSGVTTFIPSVEGKKVQIDFSKVLLANGSIYYQYLNVYDGAQVDPAKLIMRVMNGETPLIHSTSPDGALTVELADNGTTQTNDGFEATVSLFQPQAMQLDAVAVTSVTGDTFRAGAVAQSMALINIRTVNTDPVLNLNSLKIASVGAPGLVANAYLATVGGSSPKVLATAVETNGFITFDLAEPYALKEYDNTFMVLVDVSAAALNDQTISLSLSSVNLGGTDHAVTDAAPVSRSVLNKLVADAGTQDVTVYGSWDVTSKPSDYSYYGYDDIKGDQIMIIRPGTEGAVTQLTFSKLSIRFPSYSYYGTNPVFKVINGAGTSGEVLFEATNSNQSEAIGRSFSSTDPTGALTILFNTNGNRGTSTSNGFAATAVPYKSQKMALTGSQVTQAATRDIYPDDVEEEILTLKLTTEGGESPLKFDEITVDLKGCSDLVSSVKLISSGSNAQYVQPVTVMATADAAPVVTLIPVDGTDLLAENDNYYWIAFDMKDKLSDGREIDAKITSLKIGGKNVEIADADPEGVRLARNIYKFHGDDVVYVDEPIMFYDNGGPSEYYTRDHKGAVVFKPADPAKAIRMHFNSFDTGYNDELYVYNGSNTDDENQLIKLFGDKAEPRDLVSSAADGALTAYFRTGSYGLVSDGWEIVVEAFTPEPLAFESIEATAEAPVQVYAGSQDNLIMHATVEVKGERGDYNITSIVFDTEDTPAGNIAAAKAWVTGTDPAFIGAQQFGATIVPAADGSTLAFEGSYNFPHAGTYNFWLTYDVAPQAAVGSQLKASLNSVTIGGTTVASTPGVVAATSVRAGMHGDYVIGISDKADYKTFAAAIRDLSNTGVDGPVNMLIEDGTYDESFTFNQIPGASETNRVTFKSQSGNRDKVVIRYGEENKTLSLGVVNFADGASFITLQSLTVTSPANKCDGIVMLSGGCYHDTIDDCVIKGHAAATYEERVNLVYTFYLEERDKNCNYFTLSNSRLEGGYYGLSATGITNLNYPMMIHDVTVTGNTFVNQSSKALQAMGVVDGLVIRGNRFINDGSVMAAGYHNMDLYRCTGNVVVADNIIDVNVGMMRNYDTMTGDSSADAIYIRDISSARATEKRIYNNDIRINGLEGTDHTLHGIYVYDNDASLQRADIAYNTVVITGEANSYSSPFMMSAPMAGSTLVNNVLQNKAGGPLLRGTVQARLSDMTIADNALHTSGTVWAMTPSDCATFDDVVSAIAQPVGIAEEADFLSDDMHELKSAGRLMAAKPLEYVAADLLGNARNAVTPTMGAYEYTDQTGTPVWSDGFPMVDGIAVGSANLNLSADKASVARYAVVKADAAEPEDADYTDAQTVALHTRKISTVTLGDLEEYTGYKVYVKLASYLGVEADGVAIVPFTTLSAEPVYPNPVAEITTKSVTEGNEGEQLSLSGKGSGGMEPLTYRWTDQQGNLLSTTTDVTLDLTHSMTYRFTVIDNRGKEAFDEINIDVLGRQYVATFEDLKLDPESFWGGNTTNMPFYSGSFAFDYYHSSFGGSDYWGHFSYSNLTPTTYKNINDQYNSAVGSGATGSPTYGVAFVDSYVGATYLTVTNRPEGDKIDGMWLTNSAWVMDCIRNGDGLSSVPGGFQKDDYYKVTISGLRNASVVGSVDFYLADFRPELEQDRYALDSWQWVDLSSLGEVNKLWFKVESTKKNSFGITTPLYFCLDNVGDACPWQDAPQQVVRVVDNTFGTLDLNTLFDFDSSAATVTYSIESTDGIARLDSEIPGFVVIDGSTGDYEDEPFTLFAKATQQGRSEYLRIPVKLDYGNNPDENSLEQISAETVKVYPLPAHDVLNISTALTGYAAEVIDMQGRQVLSRDNLDGYTQIALPAVTPGFYVLRISHSTGSYTQRIVIR